MFKFLETFMIVYKTRSFSLAAQQLFIMQPTVSNQIKQLELQLHTELFERKSRREIVPTEAANLLYKQAGKILKNWQDVNDKITRLGDKGNEKVIFGISQTVSRILFAKIANSLITAIPNLDFDVVVSNSEGVLNQLETYKIDIGIIEKPLVTENISRISVGKDQLVKAGVDNGNWITREPGSGIGYYTEQYFREADVRPNKLIHVNNSGLIRRMVENGVGQALLSDKDLPAGIPIESLGEHFSRDFYLLLREESSHEKMLSQLQQIIKETMAASSQS